MKTVAVLSLLVAAGCAPPPSSHSRVTTLVSPATQLVSDGTQLYFASANVNAILRLSLGGGRPEVAFPNQQNPHALATASGTLWWANRLDGQRDDVMRATLGQPTAPVRMRVASRLHRLAAVGDVAFGCGVSPGLLQLPSPRFSDPAKSACGAIFTTSEAVYWASHDGVFQLRGGAVEPTVLSLSEYETEATGFAADATALYFTLASGDLRQLSRSGGEPASLANENGPRDLVLHGRDLYWATNDGVRTLRLGEPVRVETFASVEAHITSLIAVGDELIWADTQGGVYRAPVRGATE